MRKDSDNFDKQLKMIQVNLLNNPTQKEADKEEKNEPQEKKSPAPKKSEKNKDKEAREARESMTINFKDEINDKLSKIQASLQGFVTETEFTRFKTETR